MDKKTIEKIKIKKKYNELVFKITQYELINRKTPEKLLKEAQKLARYIGLPEAEF